MRKIFLTLLILYGATAYALTAEEMLLLKRGGISDEKILEIQRKEGSVPVLKINPFDWNEDGKKDIIAGSNSGRVYAYLNTGTNLEPIFNKPIEISGVEIMRFSDPYIVDWNNDGKKDILIGAKSGEISVFINKGTNQQPVFGGEIILNNGSLDVGYSSSPAITDWNGDGKKDLIVGNRLGQVFIFLNIGEDSSPEFPTNGIKTDIKVSEYATPFAIDWNSDGKFDVLCGSSDGKIYIFINESDSKNPKFNNALTLQVNNKEFKLPSPTSVIAGDWNEDGKTDLLISNKEIVKEGITPDRKEIISLGIYLLFNTGTKEKPEFKEIKQIKGKFKDDTVL